MEARTPPSSGKSLSSVAVGAFAEFTLAFTLIRETPPEVMGAFADCRDSHDAPALPALEEFFASRDELERAILATEDYFTPEEFEALPLLHKALAWRALVHWGENAYIPGPTYAVLRWDPDDAEWTLMTRSVPKMSGDEVKGQLAPLGAFASDGALDRPSRVGMIRDEYADSPVVVWSVGRAPFQFE